MKDTMKDNKGFSLVELLVVIAIMAVLVGIMAPLLLKYIEKANVSADSQLLDAVYDAVVYASVDPDVVSDPASNQILTAMRTGTITLDSLENPSNPNRFCEEVLSTLGWNNLQSATYREMLHSAHGNNATIYFSYKGTFNNPIIMWITTTDASGKKDTSKAPTSYSSGTINDIRSCIHIE